MIPVRKFLYPCVCKIHGELNHEISFLEYKPNCQHVRFLAICLECEKEHRTHIGFYSTLSAQDWNNITPQEDEIVFN